VLRLIEVNEQNPVAEVWLTMALAIPQRAVEKVILSTVGTLFTTVDTLFSLYLHCSPFLLVRFVLRH
jgi:hypothetical protein